ncbi:hypothetical protein SHOU24_87 [Vibrio phage SHOU24]|nr:hypothetical protein SHOU24_87 [Vibrio phage SHOU24]AHI61284.1 hypothetical protein SHOU24_87 [Vibrio phage SHOU24]
MSSRRECDQFTLIYFFAPRTSRLTSLNFSYTSVDLCTLVHYTPYRTLTI